ncbi:RimJ/RimL family protein N-acetyltransferase [Mucilaginibacter oryzae]|uniref:RimJ/RimL family protein N-acetyltransferase n=1 Tax=Mucilaginibacter oryzae TaxID=468058 RepID=A0A316HCF7_9SPHI|nr:GNAT family protein [Mucilaginibacter oryzae]PWK78824.1 RimJ/RimL family protein N-acetyltransferase [Mucilaginibacter oryzae]
MSANFNPEANYILEDNRVKLQPLTTGDLANLLPFALAEPDTWNYSLISAAGEDGMKAYVQAALNGRAEGKEYPFIITDKNTGEYAGCTRFYDINPAYQSLQLGYTWYGKKFRGTGLNKHCKFLMLQFAFEQLNMLRVEFRADARNQRSIAAMKSIGCTVEGILRSNMPLADGTRRDSIVLSILKSEWEQDVKEKLKNRL